MTDEPVTTGKNRKPSTFTKGDKRINRAGRPRVPKSAIELNKLIDEIAAEDVVNPATGEQVQRLRAMLRSMMTGKDGRGKVHLLDRRYGKVAERVDVNQSGDLKVIIEYADSKDTTPPATPGAEADQE